MAAPPRSLPRFSLASLLALALLLLGTAGGLLLLLRAPRTEPILLLGPSAPAPGLSPQEQEALWVLFQDHLELASGATVSRLTRLPAEGLRPDALLVEPEARREGGQLALGLRWAWGRKPEAWQHLEGRAAAPEAAFRMALDALPMPRTRGSLAPLLPREAAPFWQLLRAQGWSREASRLEEAEELARQITEREPGCASAWIARGDLLHRHLLSHPAEHPDGHGDAERFLRQGLDLAPHHSRGTFLLVQNRVDGGDHRTALAFLEHALEESPRSDWLLCALGYAARNAGLLDLAQRAQARLDRLQPAPAGQIAMDNLWLYTGDLVRFETRLQVRPGHPRNAVVHFYRGYLALVQQDRPEARLHFERACADPGAFGEFSQLAAVFAAYAGDRPAEARSRLRELEQTRAGLRVPDGEFTFKLAEAHALLGQQEQALDLLSRAFAQGFGCTRWYLDSPFLAQVRQRPRWQALIHHVQERQALFEQRFPPKAFGL